jgi:hypothetical protein
MSALKVRSQPSVYKQLQDPKSHVDYLINTSSTAKFNKPKQDTKNKKKRRNAKKKNNGNFKILSLLKGAQQLKFEYTVSDFPLSEIEQALEISNIHSGFQQASKKAN